MERALITGTTGQDGSYLAEHLLSLGYEIHAGVRQSTLELRSSRIAHLLDIPSFVIHVLDVTDSVSLLRVIDEVRPDEIYNLAAQSSVGTSFSQPLHTADVTGLGAVRLLEAVRVASPGSRFYQASSSEMFGSAPAPQNEETPFKPRSPYAVAKVYAHLATINYRETYGLHASNGILFNHDSPRRGQQFVTRKITKGVARIAAGDATEIRLGNLEPRRDWGHARDYVRAMHRILQHPTPIDLVIGTGQSRSVGEFAQEAFRCAGLDWQEHVRVDEALCRPVDVPHVRADPRLAEELIGWKAETSFEELVQEMVLHDRRSQGSTSD